MGSFSGAMVWGHMRITYRAGQARVSTLNCKGGSGPRETIARYERKRLANAQRFEKQVVAGKKMCLLARKRGGNLQSFEMISGGEEGKTYPPIARKEGAFFPLS